jgi:hypothetical protein
LHHSIAAKFQPGTPTSFQHKTNIFVSINSWFFLLWSFDPIPGHGLPLRDFTMTLIGHTTIRTHLDECSARRRDLYLITHNTQKRHRSLPPAGLEPIISSGERHTTSALHSRPFIL